MLPAFFSKVKFANPHQTNGLESETTVALFFTGLTSLTCRNYTTSIRRHRNTTTLTIPCPCLNHTHHAPPLVPVTQRRFTTPRSDQTPVPGSALHPPSRLPSGQTLVQELPQTPLPEHPAAVHPSPTVVSALVQLAVQLLARLNVPLIIISNV